MSDNKGAYKTELLKVCNGIDEDIMFSYQLLKSNDFYMAQKNQEKIVSASGDNDPNCFSEISMIKKGLIFKIRTLKRPFENRRYDNEGMITKAINEFNKKGKSYQKLNEYLERVVLEIYPEKENEAEVLKVAKFGTFQNVTDFILKSYNLHDSNNDTYLENLLTIFSSLPSDIVKVRQMYDANNKQSVADTTKSLLTDKLENNLDAFRTFKDYSELYNSNPSFFLNAFSQISREEQEKIVLSLLENKSYQDKKKADDIFLAQFGYLVEKISAKHTKKTKGA